MVTAFARVRCFTCDDPLDVKFFHLCEVKCLGPRRIVVLEFLPILVNILDLFSPTFGAFVYAHVCSYHEGFI